MAKIAGLVYEELFFRVGMTQRDYRRFHRAVSQRTVTLEHTIGSTKVIWRTVKLPDFTTKTLRHQKPDFIMSLTAMGDKGECLEVVQVWDEQGGAKNANLQRKRTSVQAKHVTGKDAVATLNQAIMRISEIEFIMWTKDMMVSLPADTPA